MTLTEFAATNVSERADYERRCTICGWAMVDDTAWVDLDGLGRVWFCRFHGWPLKHSGGHFLKVEGGYEYRHFGGLIHLFETA